VRTLTRRSETRPSAPIYPSRRTVTTFHVKHSVRRAVGNCW
jgi:hypothetical protein